MDEPSAHPWHQMLTNSCVADTPFRAVSQNDRRTTSVAIRLHIEVPLHQVALVSSDGQCHLQTVPRGRWGEKTVDKPLQVELR